MAVCSDSDGCSRLRLHTGPRCTVGTFLDTLRQLLGGEEKDIHALSGVMYLVKFLSLSFQEQTVFSLLLLLPLELFICCFSGQVEEHFPMQFTMFHLREKEFGFLFTSEDLFTPLQPTPRCAIHSTGLEIYSCEWELQHGWNQAVCLGAREDGSRAGRRCAGLAGCRQGVGKVQAGCKACPKPRGCSGAELLLMLHTLGCGMALLFALLSSAAAFLW